MPNQFLHTDQEQRSSMVYSTSMGKAGLFIPADYISSDKNDTIVDETEDDEGTSSSGDNLHNINNHSNSNDLMATDPVRLTKNTGEMEFLLGDEDEDSSNRFMHYQSINDAQETHNRNSVVEQSRHRSRTASMCKSLIDEERDLLIDNKLLSNTTGQRSRGNSIVESMYGNIEPVDAEVASEIMTTWNDAIDSGKPIQSSFKRETQVIAFNALPLIFTFILQNSLSLASIFSVSHLGTKELGGVTLGSMTANITGLAAIQGLCTCLDTLCAQAYGAKNYHLVGVLIQRCATITILAFLPIMYIWWSWSETILSWMIPERELCVLAAKYLRITALGVPGFILFECGKRFLQCQGIFHASTIILFVCAPLNALMNYIFVWNKTIGIGYLGAPLSVAINYWLMAIGLMLYTIFTKHESNPMKCWNGIIKKRQIFKNWRKMFGLALPGIIMVEAEFLGFEILTIFASHISTNALAAQSIVSTVASLAYQVPFSISVSTSTRVANLIGASLYKSCIITCKVSLLLSFVCSSFNMMIIVTFRDQIAKLFSTETAVVNLVISTLPTLAFMQLFDAFNASTAGCLRGQGRQKIGGYINLFAFYCIGIPMSYMLTFSFNMGVGGLWFGITCALIMMSICQGYAVFHGDWSQILQAARLRNSEGARVS